MLADLPNMTRSDFAQARSGLAQHQRRGALRDELRVLKLCAKGAPFETVDELRLVYGSSMDLLAGDDLNRNGVLDANETNSTGGTTPNFGLMEYTTVFSREPNFHSDGTSLTNVNTLTSADEMNSFFQTYGVSSDESVATSVYRTIKPPGGTANPCKGGLDFCLRCLNAGMNANDLAKIYGDFTTSTNAYTYGRVNINTAGEPVLTALMMGANIDQDTAEGAAQSLVSYREQNPGSLTSPAWLVSALGQNNTVVTNLAAHDWITTRSFQFTADIAAVGPLGRGYRRVKFIFDISDGTPKIIYRQDLSRLGWALGEKVRETLVANNTP